MALSVEHMTVDLGVGSSGPIYKYRAYLKKKKFFFFLREKKKKDLQNQAEETT